MLPVRQSLPGDRQLSPAVDNRKIAAMRLVLAASGLLIIIIDPAEPNRLVVPTYTALSLYTLYSAALYVLALRAVVLPGILAQQAHWLDVGWYTLLISLSRGTSSIFFFGFFFAILVASFQQGYSSGVRTAVVSCLLFTTVSFATAVQAGGFELNRFLLRSVYLLVLGYMIAYWGGRELGHKRQLALLKEISTHSHPRLGIEGTLGILLVQVRAFYEADSCQLLMHSPGAGAGPCYRVDAGPGVAPVGQSLPAVAQPLLFALPTAGAVVYNRRPRSWLGWDREPGYAAFDATTGGRLPLDRALGDELAALLDTDAWIGAPLGYPNEPVGRLYLTARQHTFTEEDARFLLQISDHLLLVIQNSRLVDQLAADAAEQERQRIARDIHDSVIQPYIGLQLGLRATYKKLATGSEVTADLRRLIGLSDEAIIDLRGFVQELTGESERGASLLPAIRRFAGKFTAATGIGVQVDAPAEFSLPDRLATDVFQLVSEGLSNIRRHTQARRADIVLTCRTDQLVLRIENDGADPGDNAFIPHSITGRTTALGGAVRVEHPDPDHTAVIVEIPL